MENPAGHLISFALAYLLLAISPGPNFMIVSAAGLRSQRANAIAAALGVAFGACLLYLAVALCAGLMPVSDTTKRLGAIFFGTYLVYLSVRSLRRSRVVARWTHSTMAEPTSGYFRMAFLTAIANPVTAMFFASSHLVASSSFLTAVCAAVIFAIAASWFTMIAVMASNGRLQSLSARHLDQFDLLFAAVFLFLGITTLLSSLP
ncbi:LysE family translocator [Rhizobium sp. RCC_161_2]|uniref:LysE family translocator n=1 Tax=Rhizobium sp. RCC_161_2 TaxID=3239219 RepID=UPI00352497DF